MPIAGLFLTFIACYELIQLIIEHNNLNQIAKKANSGDGIYGADITDMQAKQDEIWEAAKEILARLATIQ